MNDDVPLIESVTKLIGEEHIDITFREILEDIGKPLEILEKVRSQEVKKNFNNLKFNL